MNIGEYHIGGNTYKVDDLGNIYLLKSGLLKKPARDPEGYLFYTFHVGNSHKSFRAARIVWEVFHGPVPEGYVIDHINSVRDDNRLCNLQLLTPKENIVKAKAKAFSIKDPQGKVWEGVNFKEFCTQHKLNYGNASRVLLGHRKSSQGWTK